MGYCIHCGYDLRAHRLGAPCPECGRVVNVTAPAPLPSTRVGMVALGAVLLLPLVWIAGGWRGNFYALCSASGILVVLIPVAMYQQRRARGWAHAVSILLSMAAATIPVLTLALFVTVFIIGRSSNAAQMASDTGFDYWGLWFDMWPLLLFGNPVCFLVGLVALATPPYQPRFVASWALPIAVLIATAAAAHIATVYFPDA